MSLFKYLIFIFLFFVLTLSADWYIERNMKVDDYVVLEKIYSKGPFYKETNPDNSLSVNWETEQVLFENHRHRIFWEGSFEEFQIGMQKVMQESEARMFEGYSEEERKAAEAQLKKYKENPQKMTFTVEASGRNENLLGYDCQEYIVRKDTNKIAAFYHSSKIHLIENQYVGKAKAFFKKLDYADASDFLQSEAMESYLFNGVIIKMIVYGDYTMPDEVEEYVNIQSEDIDPTFFGVTDGYSLMPLFEVLKLDLLEDEVDTDESNEE
ncbi:MAG: hypothetical protein JXR34_07820 [Bacteroidales bacterium]|nr:hypothetical protein [Bacteroidales bacterium]